MKTRPHTVIPAALSASLGFTMLFCLPRLPLSSDMIVPRRAGFALFSAAMAHRGGLGLLASALLGLCFLILAISLWRSWRELRAAFASAKVSRLAATGLGLVLLIQAWRLAVAEALDVIQNAWFPPESLDLREPLAICALCFLSAALFLRAAAAALAWCAPGAPKSARTNAVAWPTALLALGLSIKAVGLRYDAGKGSLAEAAGCATTPRLTRTFIVLTEKDGAPNYEVHQIEIGVPGKSEFSLESLRAVARYVLSRPSVFRLAGLRYLYGGCAMAMDPAGLRAALAAGHSLGDPAARVLLLESLAWARPGEPAARALSLLSREDQYRIGALAAAQLAVAYDHLGDTEKAAHWRERSGIPVGLLSRQESGGALKPGLLRGRIRGARRAVRVGLYAHRDPRAPYNLGPAQLVDAVTADRAGRFEFKGLAAGDYFLALSLDFDSGRAPERIRLRGNRGDAHLSKERPRAELPALELSY